MSHVVHLVVWFPVLYQVISLLNGILRSPDDVDDVDVKLAACSAIGNVVYNGP